MTPWDILELDPSGATTRDVKRAYARVLRRHRPEDDREGFAKVYEAYQQALNELEVGPLLGTQQVELFPPDIGFEDEAFDDTEALADLVASSDPPSSGPATLPFEDLLSDLESNTNSRPMQVLSETLTRAGSLKKRFAKAILADPVRFSNEAAARFACRLSSLIAFTNPATSEQLLNFAYEYLPLSARDGFDFQSLWISAVTPSFKPQYMQAEQLAFWSGALAEPRRVDWTSPEARAALKHISLLRFQGCHDVLIRILPANESKRFRKPATKYVPPAPPVGLVSEIESLSNTQRFLHRWVKGVAAVCVLCFTLVFLVTVFPVGESVRSFWGGEQEPRTPTLAASVFPKEEFVESPAGRLRVLKTANAEGERFRCYQESLFKRGPAERMEAFREVRLDDGGLKYRVVASDGVNEAGDVLFHCFEQRLLLSFDRAEYVEWRKFLRE